MRIVANRERCISAGMCVMNAPELFEQDPGDGRVLVVVEAVPPEAAAEAREAVESCPSGALALEDGP